LVGQGRVKCNLQYSTLPTSSICVFSSVIIGFSGFSYINDLRAFQPAHLFDPFFLKVSIDPLSQNRYIPIRNPQGGGKGISSFSGEKSLGSEGNVNLALKYRPFLHQIQCSPHVHPKLVLVLFTCSDHQGR
jgi:hypothetical protein